jgi:hypothetical protein
MTLLFWKILLKQAAVSIGIITAVFLVLTLFEVFTGKPAWWLMLAAVIALIVGEAYDQYRKERKEL